MYTSVTIENIQFIIMGKGKPQRYTGVLTNDLRHEFSFDPLNPHNATDEQKLEVTFELAEILCKNAKGVPMHHEHVMSREPFGVMRKMWIDGNKLMTEFEIDDDHMNKWIDSGEYVGLSLSHLMQWTDISNSRIVECSLCSRGWRPDTGIIAKHKGKPGQVEETGDEIDLWIPTDEELEQEQEQYEQKLIIKNDNDVPSMYSYVMASQFNPADHLIPYKVITVFPQSSIVHKTAIMPDTNANDDTSMQQDHPQEEMKDFPPPGEEQDQQQDQEVKDPPADEEQKTLRVRQDLPKRKPQEDEVEYWMRVVESPDFSYIGKYARAQLTKVLKEAQRLADTNNRLTQEVQGIKADTFNKFIPFIKSVTGIDRQSTEPLPTYINASASSLPDMTTLRDHVMNVGADMSQKMKPQQQQQQSSPSPPPVVSEQLLILQAQQRIQELELEKEKLKALNRNQQSPRNNNNKQQPKKRQYQDQDQDDQPQEDEEYDQEYNNENQNQRSNSNVNRSNANTGSSSGASRNGQVKNSKGHNVKLVVEENGYDNDNEMVDEDGEAVEEEEEEQQQQMTSRQRSNMNLKPKQKGQGPPPRNQNANQNLNKRATMRPQQYYDVNQLRQPGCIPENSCESGKYLEVKASNIMREIPQDHIRGIVDKEQNPRIKALYGNIVNLYGVTKRHPEVLRSYAAKERREEYEERINGLSSTCVYTDPSKNNLVYQSLKEAKFRLPRRDHYM